MSIKRAAVKMTSKNPETYPTNESLLRAGDRLLVNKGSFLVYSRYPKVLPPASHYWMFEIQRQIYHLIRNGPTLH